MFKNSKESKELLAKLAEHDADVKRKEENAYANLVRFHDPELGGVDITETEKIQAIIKRSQNG